MMLHISRFVVFPFLAKVTLCCVALCLSLASTTAYSNVRQEQKVKAAYLFNFTKYIYWPKERFSAQSPNIDICLKADEEFISFMKELVNERRVGKQQRMVNIVPLNDAKNCHLSFLQYPIIEPHPLLGQSVIVLDSSEVRHPDWGIRFFRQQSKLRFEINVNQISQQKATVSSELLKLAKII